MGSARSRAATTTTAPRACTIGNTRQARRHAPRLSPEQQEELRQALAGPAPDEDRWCGRTVAEWMAERLGRPVSRYRGWVYLKQLQPQPRHGVPRPRHALADPEEQEACKKTTAVKPA